MELEDLKNTWDAYDRKLDKSLQLNMQLLKKLNFDKVNNKLKSLLLYKLAEMFILMIMIIYLFNFTMKYFSISQFSIPAVLLILFITIGYISDIRQTVIILQLKSGYSLPVSTLQKKAERLKVLITNYVKCSFLSIPFYPLLLILGGKIFLNIDFWAPQYRLYLLVNIVIGILLLPAFIWLYLQLSKNNVRQTWVKNFLSGSGWNQADSAYQFLSEIKEFEKEE